MQLICVVGNGLNRCGPLKRLLSCQKHSRPIDMGVQRSSLHHIAHSLKDLSARASSTRHVESRCGAVVVGSVCLLPPLSSGGAQVPSP
jgi:hypothetical protein